jgi:hypothetical protein
MLPGLDSIPAAAVLDPGVFNHRETVSAPTPTFTAIAS